jgi:hypothetical protein
LELERIYEEARNCQEDSMERVSCGSKRPKKFPYKSWITDVLIDEEEERSEEEDSEEEQEDEDR